MESLGPLLGLAAELSALLYGSYFFHSVVAEGLDWDPSLTLTGLVVLSLILWFVHVYVYFEKNPS